MHSQHTGLSPSFIAVVCLALVVLEGQAKKSARIVGGTNASPGEYPWAAYFENPIGGGYVGICGGSLISAHYVLTAGHCCVGEDGEEAPVRAGQIVSIGGYYLTDMEQGYPAGYDGAGEQLTIEATYLPHDFNLSTLFNDLCIVELPQASSVVNRIQLNFNDTQDLSGTVTVIGWGVTSENGSQPNVLQQVSVPIVPHAECVADYEGSAIITNNMICAGLQNTGGKDSCQGDSGGALFKKTNNGYLQIGIVSFGDGCAQPLFPGVYTRVSSYQDFICSTTKNEPYACTGGTDDGVGSASSLLSHAFLADRKSVV